MFIQQLFEDSAKRIIVTYPGRFQPFHKGHAEVFANLQRQFGSENVFIVTGNKTDAVKSPFNFSDKVRFMHAMGIPNHQIIETDKVYDLPGRFEPVRDQVVFITVVGAPDASRLNPGATKKDGSQSYFQNIPQSKTEFETADKHGYVIVEPEHPESIVLGGKRYDVSHGTPTRELWNTIRDNPAQRGEFVTQLYGRADGDLANTLDKIPTGAAPAPEPAKKMKNVKKDLTKVQHDPNAEQQVAEAGNRGYDHGFASPTAPSLGGSRRREDDEYHVPDPAPSIWYIRADGKIIKDKMGTPFQFRDKEAARKAAMTMMSKPFNAGKKFVLTTQPQDKQPVAEERTETKNEKGEVTSWRDESDWRKISKDKQGRGRVTNLSDKARRETEKLAKKQDVAEAAGPVTHRIGLTVTDPNHPMVSKRGDTYHKTVRVTGDDREKAINGAIAHARRKGYKVHDHHYIGTVDDEIKEFAPPGGDDGNDGFSDDTLKRLAAQWYHGDEDPRVEKTLMAAGWEIGQDEGYDDEPGVFVVQAGDVNGNSYMSWPANELRQGMAETTGDKPFDNMMKTIKQGTNKQKTADRKEQQKQTQQRARDAFGNMFGGGNPADKLSIRKGVAEGLNENAEQLSVGDPVIISGQGIEFEGKTGDIDSFGDMKRFVVVNLYNHGKHSFHSSDVSYNDYADQEDDLDEDLYQYDKADPYNSEFAPRAGMGRMTLRGWKQQMIKRTAELAQQMAAAGQDIDKSALWDNVHAKLKSMNMDPIAQEIEQAQAELEKIRQRGGVRSRAFNK